MVEHCIKAIRVHGPGDGHYVMIRFGEERLHASGVFSNVYSAQLYHPVRMAIALKKTWPTKSHKISQGGKPQQNGGALANMTDASKINPEIHYLSRIRHISVVRLLYYFALGSSDEGERCHCMVFDYLPTDMARLRRQNRQLSLLDAKLYAFQMFAAINHVNSLGIAHRDVKPSNMIVDDRLGILKLADFGNAKELREFEENTPYQVTRYYRAPELIFGSTHYTTAIDIWACGCVLPEFVTGRVLLQGRTRDDQARLIIDIFGYPNKEQCTAMKINRPRYARKSSRGLKVLFEGCNAPSDMINLVSSILKYEPNSRLKGFDVLAHSYFDELRQIPPKIRENGRPLPKLDFSASQTQTAKADDEISDNDEDDDKPDSDNDG